MILDTSFFLDLIDGDEAAVTLAHQMEAGESPQRVPAQVVYELYVGVGYTDRTEAEIRKLGGVLASRPIVETTEQIAKKAGRIDGQLRRDGDRVAMGDLLVGATAVVYEEAVVTRNESDFVKIPGIDITTY